MTTVGDIPAVASPVIAADDADLERRFGGLKRLYGARGYARVRAARVAVVGLGGVGSWAVEALARSGVAQLVLVDLDHVSESNVNRQIQALGATLGMSKAQALARRIADIHPGCVVHCVEEFADADNWPGLLPIEVDQHQLGDAAAGQRLDGPRADAAQTDDGHARGTHVRIAAGAVQALEAAEAALEIRVVRRGDGGRRCGDAGSEAHFKDDRRSRPATAASDFGYVFIRSVSVALAARMSRSSIWQLATASSASGARACVGAAAMNCLNVTMASLKSRLSYCALPSQ